MDLSVYQVIRGPVLSSKALRLHKDSKKLVLEVHPKATKAQIKEALYKVFQIKKVIKINVVSRQGKIKRVRGGETQRVFRKRAIVTLPPDQSIEMLSQASMTPQVA
jgi:large subunit ribosomal protein L23